MSCVWWLVNDFFLLRWLLPLTRFLCSPELFYFSFFYFPRCFHLSFLSFLVSKRYPLWSSYEYGRVSLFVLSLAVLCTIQLKLHVCEDTLTRKLQQNNAKSVIWQSMKCVSRLCNTVIVLKLHATLFSWYSPYDNGERIFNMMIIKVTWMFKVLILPYVLSLLHI
jgi:hypothetical protein